MSIVDKKMNEQQEPVLQEAIVISSSGFLFPSTIRDTGIAIEWHEIWHEVEVWYGDVQKKESAEQFLKRLQSRYSVAKNCL
jgi:hypothetical protein